MDNEKIRAEFEAWMETRAINYDRDTDAWGREKYKHSHVQAMFEGYLAAAKSRDELIGKLMKLLNISKQVHIIANDWHAPTCYDVEIPEGLDGLREPDSDEPDWVYIHHLIKHLEQALEEAKAHGHGGMHGAR